MPAETTYEIRITALSRNRRAAQLIAEATGLTPDKVQSSLLVPPFQLPESLPLARAVSLQRELEKCGLSVELVKIVTEPVAPDEVDLVEEAAAAATPPGEITLGRESYRLVAGGRLWRRWWWTLLLLLLLLVLIWWLPGERDTAAEDAARRHSQAQQLLLTLDKELSSPSLLPEADQRVAAAQGLLMQLESLLHGIGDEEQRFWLQLEQRRQQQRLTNLKRLRDLPERAQQWLQQELADFRRLPHARVSADSLRLPRDSSLPDFFDRELERFLQRVRTLRDDAEFDPAFLRALERIEALRPFAGDEHGGSRLDNLLTRQAIQRQRTLGADRLRHNPTVTRYDNGSQLFHVCSLPAGDSLTFRGDGGDTTLAAGREALVLPLEWEDAGVFHRGARLPQTQHRLLPRLTAPGIARPDYTPALLQLLGEESAAVHYTPHGTVVISTAGDDSPFRRALEMAWLIFNLDGRGPQRLYIAANGHLAIVPTAAQWSYFLTRSHNDLPVWNALFL